MTPTQLSSKQRAHLRALAHKLKPVVHVGSDGVTDAVVKSAEEALSSRELLKAKVRDGAPEDTATTARQLAERLPGALVPLTTGRTFVLFRPSPENPVIQLP